MRRREKVMKVGMLADLVSIGARITSERWLWPIGYRKLAPNGDVGSVCKRVFERSRAAYCLHSLFLDFRGACRKHNFSTQCPPLVAVQVPA